MITVKSLAPRATDTALPPKGNRARGFTLRALLLFTAASAASAFAASHDPDGPHSPAVMDAMITSPQKVLKIIFPAMESYRADDLTWGRHGLDRVALSVRDLERLFRFHLRGPLDPTIENARTPYTFYTVLGPGNRPLGVVVGTNQRWKGGALDVFTAFDDEKRIQDVYVQRAEGVAALPFRDGEYRRRFRRFSLDYPPDDAYLDPPSPLPQLNELLAHQRVVRGVRLSLLLYQSLYLAQPEALEKVPAGL